VGSNEQPASSSKAASQESPVRDHRVGRDEQQATGNTQQATRSRQHATRNQRQSENHESPVGDHRVGRDEEIPELLALQGFGCRVQGAGFRVQGSGHCYLPLLVFLLLATCQSPPLERKQVMSLSLTLVHVLMNCCFHCVTAIDVLQMTCARRHLPLRYLPLFIAIDVLQMTCARRHFPLRYLPLLTAIDVLQMTCAYGTNM